MVQLLRHKSSVEFTVVRRQYKANGGKGGCSTMFGSVTYLAPPPTIIYTKVTPLTAEVNNRDGDAVNKSKRKKDTRVSFGQCSIQYKFWISSNRIPVNISVSRVWALECQDHNPTRPKDKGLIKSGQSWWNRKSSRISFFKEYHRESSEVKVRGAV